MCYISQRSWSSLVIDLWLKLFNPTLKQSQPRHVTFPKPSVINGKAGYNERSEGRGSSLLHVGTPVCNRLSSCTSSSSDWTTGVFDPSSLEAWLSQVEFEEVDNIRVLISQGSEILKDMSFLRNPSSFMSVWPRAGEEIYNLLTMEFYDNSTRFLLRSEPHGFNIQWVTVSFETSLLFGYQ